jgi:hypothetical protein
MIILERKRQMKITYKDSTIKPKDLDLTTLYNKIVEHMPDLKDVIRQGDDSLAGKKSGVQMNATLNDKGLVVVVKMPWYVGKKSISQAKNLITQVVNDAKEETCIEHSSQ